MKYTQKPVSIFPNNVLLQSHEILHFVVISHEYKFFKCVWNVTILSLLSSWHRHAVVSDAWFSSAHHIVTHISSSLIHIGTFPTAISLICLLYMNKSFVMKMSCLLPRAKLQRVTFFMKRSYLLPRENFKLPYLQNQAHWDPGICTQLRSSHIHSIHQKSRDFINGNYVYFDLICAVWSSRGRAGKKVTAVTFFRCLTVALKSFSYSAVIIVLSCHGGELISTVTIVNPSGLCLLRGTLPMVFCDHTTWGNNPRQTCCMRSQSLER